MTNEELLRDPYVAAFPENVAFWEAAAKGVLLLPRCEACGKVHWHPRAHCPFCHSARVAWIEASGRGTIHTFTVIRRAQGDSVLALVELDEGPLMMTNIVDTPHESLRIGQAVQVRFRASLEGRHAPVFSAGDVG